MKTYIEPIVGRYAHYDIDGRRCRVYFEEAGQGIPMVCMHTAGADGRQYRHMMCDPDITKDFRVMAFDMPWHGKSYPPEDWAVDEEYRLSTDLYVKTIMAFCEAMELDRPVAIGSSIGGRILLQLAHQHGERFRAFIAMEAADHQQPWYDTSWLHRGDVHGGEVCAALVSGMCAPQSPLRYRMETLWQYAQGGPGIFKGDLWFYRVDSDLRGKLTNIDAARTPLYMLTGEYDFSCTPEDTVRTAESIPGAKVTVMKEEGHFPMSENPQNFKKYLTPVLNEILSR
jgi:pimeloyl-ACP methyl ester carboxylesterase